MVDCCEAVADVQFAVRIRSVVQCCAIDLRGGKKVNRASVWVQELAVSKNTNCQDRERTGCGARNWRCISDDPNCNW